MSIVEHGNGEVTIYIGDVFASPGPLRVRTLLGSCIAVCLYDPIVRVGGMNHFMLPVACGSSDAESTRFGAYAMDCLIGELMMRCKADRRRLVAKVFGGAHVVDIRETADSVPQRNVRFIRQFLADEDIPIVAEHLGGNRPRLVVFQTGEGRARVKELDAMRARPRLVESERKGRTEKPAFGDVTLF
jgi:chemotaxis protein CheD